MGRRGSWQPLRIVLGSNRLRRWSRTPLACGAAGSGEAVGRLIILVHSSNVAAHPAQGSLRTQSGSAGIQGGPAGAASDDRMKHIALAS